MIVNYHEKHKPFEECITLGLHVATLTEIDTISIVTSHLCVYLKLLTFLNFTL